LNPPYLSPFKQMIATTPFILSDNHTPL